MRSGGVTSTVVWRISLHFLRLSFEVSFKTFRPIDNNISGITFFVLRKSVKYPVWKFYIRNQKRIYLKTKTKNILVIVGNWWVIIV